jgi:hypothetical protein
MPILPNGKRNCCSTVEDRGQRANQSHYLKTLFENVSNDGFKQTLNSRTRGAYLRLLKKRGLARHIIWRRSPTDSAKDRLTGYFYGNDKQCLEQAVMICQMNKVEMENINEWAKHEGQTEKFKEFLKRLSKNNPLIKSSPRGKT